MITALFSFFGGSVFRMLWGEISSFVNKAQDHKQELDRMNLQNVLDAAQHERNMESIKLQADQQIKVVQVQAESAIGEIEANGWLEAVKATAIKTGLAWVDAWNAVIRPAVATWSIVMITLNEVHVITMSENTVAVTGAALGIYLVDRTLFKRGK